MSYLDRRLAVITLVLGVVASTAAAGSWDEVVATARGQTVYFNAWAGDPQTNAFIAYVGAEAMTRYGVKVEQVKLKDTAEAVTRVIAEKAAGRDKGGSVDLIWINGPNFLAMKTQNLLFGPVTEMLPNDCYVDTTKNRGLPTLLVTHDPADPAAAAGPMMDLAGYIHPRLFLSTRG